MKSEILWAVWPNGVSVITHTSERRKGKCVYSCTHSSLRCDMEPSVQLRVLAASPAGYFHFTSWAYVRGSLSRERLNYYVCVTRTVVRLLWATSLFQWRWTSAFQRQLIYCARLGSVPNAVLKYFRPPATGTSLGFWPRKSGRICSWHDK